MTRLASAVTGGPGPGVVLVQVTLVALLGLLAWLAVRRGGPALRGAVLLAALVGLLIVPGLAAVAPVWLPLPLFAWLDDPGPEPADPADAAPPPPIVGPAALVVSPAEPPGKLPGRLTDPTEPLDDLFRPPEDAELIFVPSLPPEVIAPPVRTRESPRRHWSPAGVLAVVWLLGALACLTLALARLALLYHWARQARPVRDPEWTACLKSLTEQYGLPAVALRESPAVTSPLTLGLFRRVILLPAGRRTWSAEQRALILAHELAHVRRRDFLAGLIAELAACLCWYHPLVRWLAGRLRLEQEYTADAWAVSAANDAKNYVRCLARLALELGQGQGALAPAFWRRRPEILRRIDMLRRNPHGHSPRLGKGTAWTVAVLAAAACLAVAGVGPLRSVAKELAPAEAAQEVKAPATADRHGDPLPAGALARLGTTRWRHGANVTFVAFGPEGKTLITAGQDNTVRVWDLATGQEVRRFARPKTTEIRTGPAVIPPARPLPPEADKARPADAKAKAKAPAVLRQLAKPAEAKSPVPKAQPAVKATQAAAQKAQQAQLEVQARLAALRGDPYAFTVAVAPDGKTVAVANANVVQLYEVETGKELHKIDGPRTGLAGLLFSPDGRTLAARGGDGALTLWETASGQTIHQINPPSQPNNVQRLTALRFGGGNDAPGMAFAPDGKSLAVATTEFKEQTITGSVKIWDVTTGQETGQIKGPEGIAVSTVAFAPGGKALAFGAANVIHLYEPDTAKEIRQIRAPDGVVSLVFSPDGKSLAVRSRNQQVRLWETETGQELHQLGDAIPTSPRSGVILASPVAVAPEVRNLAFGPDGRRIATASGSTVRLWDSATGKELPLSNGHPGPLAAVALSGDGKSAVSWGGDQTIRRWEAATGQLLGSFQAPAGTTLAALAPDGRAIALANADNSIRVMDTATGKELRKLAGPTTGTGALAFAPDGQVLAARGGDNAIQLYDLVRGSEMRPIAAQAANNTLPGSVVVVNAVGRMPNSARAGLVFSPDGQLLASLGPMSSPFPGNRSTRITTDLYDVATGKLLRKIESSQPVVSFAFSPDSRVLATEFADQSITLWEVASGKERVQLSKVAANAAPIPPGPMAFAVATDRRIAYAEPAGPATLAFSPDGQALVARGPDFTVRVWDVATGKEVRQQRGHEGRVETIAFAPDGKTIASGSADTTILLWDAAALMKDLPKPELVELPDGAVEPLWGDLVSEDAGKALQSVLKLAGDPKQAVPFLSEWLKPAIPIDPQQVERWVADLESEKYAVRQQAAANLVKTGEQVVPALQKVLAAQPTIETRKRVEDLLDKLTGGTLTTEQLRLVRAVEALERMGAPEARQLLRTLAEGAPGALPTRQAQAALNRGAR